MAITYEPLAPTQEAISAWLKKNKRGTRTDGPIYGVNIRTKRGSWRHVVAVREKDGIWPAGYYTIPAEGKSSAGRETFIRASEIVAANGSRID